MRRRRAIEPRTRAKPSRGDTCFPGILQDAADVIVYNYTSPLDPGGADLAWIAGQTRPTIIYRTVLTGL